MIFLSRAIELFRSIPIWARVVLFLVVVIGIQFSIPGELTPFRTTLNGQSLGVTTLSQVKDRIAGSKADLHLAMGDQSVSVSPDTAGISVDVTKTTEHIPTIDPIERVIPFGVAFHFLKSTDIETVSETNVAQLTKFADEMAKKYTKEPVNATAVIEDGKFVVKRSRSGQTVTPQAIITAIQQGTSKHTSNVTVTITPIEPTVTEQAFVSSKKTFDSITDKTLTVSVGDAVRALKEDEVRSILEVQKAPDGVFKLGTNKAALTKLLLPMSEHYNQAAGTTQVTMVDGVVTSRIVGPSGRQINIDAVQAQLQEWLKAPATITVALATQEIAPKVVTSRSYSQSSAALQAKINDWVAAHNGSYQIAVRELNGKGRVASYNVSQQTVMASTYKLFVAYAIYHQAEAGAINLGTVVLNGMTIEQCISKAIINSDNDCAIALGKYVGWAKADQIVADAGFQNVKLNNYNASGGLSGDKMVNANELAKFLAQLSEGSLMNATNTGHLLGYMKSQVYRSGIPAGSHGATVADKVGFLEGYLHDAAIVYAPKATYALVIMSSGSSWSNISDLADAIYTFMAQ